MTALPTGARLPKLAIRVPTLARMAQRAVAEVLGRRRREERRRERRRDVKRAGTRGRDETRGKTRRREDPNLGIGKGGNQRDGGVQRARASRVAEARPATPEPEGVVLRPQLVVPQPAVLVPDVRDVLKTPGNSDSGFAPARAIRPG